MSIETFTLPRSSVDHWAAEVLELATGLSAACDRLQFACEDLELRRQVADLRESASALVLDFVAHDVVPQEAPVSGENRQRLMLYPTLPAAVLDGLDKLDPLSQGFTRANSAHFAAMAMQDGGDNDDSDYDSD